MKQCNQCGKVKDTTQFYKRTASKDGLQLKCKACCKIVNENFREAKPDYQSQWYKKNWHKWVDYMSEWVKENVVADNSRSVIYYIVNPEQKVYVGSTQTAFSYRKAAHKTHYKLKTKIIPLLHQSFDMYGYDKHKWYVINMSGVDRETLRTIEYQMINGFHKNGMSLNVRLK